MKDKGDHMFMANDIFALEFSSDVRAESPRLNTNYEPLWHTIALLAIPEVNS